MDVRTLLDTAEMLIQLAKQQALSSREDEIVAVWQEMIRQAVERTKPHGWIDLAPGVPYWEVGNNEKESPFYEKFKSFWQAMERMRVPDQSGKPFVYQESIKRGMLNGNGGNAEFEASIKFLAKTDQGKQWFNDPLNANYLPKSQDMLLLS